MTHKNGHNSYDDLPKPILTGRDDLISLYYKAWDLAKDHICHDENMTATSFMDEGFCPEFHWVWDTCFMVMFCRHAPDLFPGIESLDNFYAIQKENGYITMAMRVEDGEDAYPLEHGRINPPLFAWAEWDYYNVTGDNSRFEKVLPHLVKLDQWIEKNRRRSDGSYWFSDCGSSGMDNSPRTCRRNIFGNNTSFIDLASQQALSAMLIAKIADVLDNSETKQEYSQNYLERKQYINEKLWSPRDKFYYDAYLDGHFTGCKTAASFWPLLANVANSDQAFSLVNHLQNPNEFNRPHPVPTLSFDHPNYKEDGGYWLGGVWAPTNYMIVRGLAANGYAKLAKQIAEKHLHHMHHVWQTFEPSTIWECYSPEYILPAQREEGGLVRPDFVGWSGLGPIAMLIENIIGITVDYPNRKIYWQSDDTNLHGIENLRFGPHRISLKALPRESASVKPEIEIEADCEFELEFVL